MRARCGGVGRGGAGCLMWALKDRRPHRSPRPGRFGAVGLGVNARSWCVYSPGLSIEVAFGPFSAESPDFWASAAPVPAVSGKTSLVSGGRWTPDHAVGSLAPGLGTVARLKHGRPLCRPAPIPLPGVQTGRRCGARATERTGIQRTRRDPDEEGSASGLPSRDGGQFDLRGSPSRLAVPECPALGLPSLRSKPWAHQCKILVGLRTTSLHRRRLRHHAGRVRRPRGVRYFNEVCSESRATSPP